MKFCTVWDSTKMTSTSRHRSFSGGWRIRLNLARTLMTPSDLLLLDEPTNHLDLDATLWLETWLKRYEGTLLIIAHDRDFLDNIAGEIVHIDAAKATVYSGNYSSFERQQLGSPRPSRGDLQEATERNRNASKNSCNGFAPKRPRPSRCKAASKPSTACNVSPPSMPNHPTGSVSPVPTKSPIRC